MKVTIRQEKPEDFEIVSNITYLAFREMEHADGDEHLLVAKLRRGEDYIPELSLVASLENTVIGHIMFTRCRVINGKTVAEGLCLGPVSVHPDHQRKGTGGILIRTGIEISAKMGFGFVSLLGHPGYYPRFGFKKASDYDILCPVPAPPEAFMILELTPGALKNIKGTVQFAKEFGI